MKSRTWLCLALAWAGCAGGGHAGAGAFGAIDDALAVCAAGDVVHGIDVSHYDGTIDWAQVKASGIDFAFMKASEGLTFVDPMFAANWKAAGDAGLIRGGYHFFRPEDDPVMQADFFVATAGMPQPGDLPLTIDLEVTDSVTDVATPLSQFLARVQEQTGLVPIVYTSARFWTEMNGPATGYDQYPLWDAQWTTACPNMPEPWPVWAFWQNASTGTVPGISGMANVDLDQFNGSLAALQAFVGAGGAVDGGSDDGGADGGSVTVGDDMGPTIAPHHKGCTMGGADDARQDAGLAVLCAMFVAALALGRRLELFS